MSLCTLLSLKKAYKKLVNQLNLVKVHEPLRKYTYLKPNNTGGCNIMFKVLITDPLNEEGIQPLRDADNIEVVIDTEMSPEQLEEQIADFDALLVRSQTDRKSVV